MTPRPQFDAEYIESEFKSIGTALDQPVTVYLIGGGSLALRGLKETTKDIDIVVESGEAHEQLYTALTDSGYDEVTPLEAAYEELGATSCIQNEDGCRIETFDRQVVDTLVLSDGMKARSDPWLETGQLTVGFVSTEDVFLFKAVATRPADIDDMRVLVEDGLEFDVIENELAVQIDLLEDLQFVTYVGESLGTLAEQYGVTLPLADHVDELVEQYYDALEVRLALDGPTAMEELQSALDIPQADLEARLETLEDTGDVVLENGIITPGEETHQ